MFNQLSKKLNMYHLSGLGIRSFNLSIFDLLIFLIFKKIVCDRIYLVNPWQRLTVIESIFRYFNKKTINLIEKKNIFFLMFLTVFLLLCQKIKSLPSIFDILKIDGIDLLSLIFKQDWAWLYQSRRSLKNDRFDKKNDDQIPNLTFY